MRFRVRRRQRRHAGLTPAPRPGRLCPYCLPPLQLGQHALPQRLPLLRMELHGVPHCLLPLCLGGRALQDLQRLQASSPLLGVTLHCNTAAPHHEMAAQRLLSTSKWQWMTRCPFARCGTLAHVSPGAPLAATKAQKKCVLQLLRKTKKLVAPGS